MAYVPREKKFQINGKIISVFVILIALVAAGSYTYFQNNEEEQEVFTICGWNEKKTQEQLNKKFNATYTISDYLFYGESLALYQKDYTLDENDDMSRKSVELVNICSDEAITFTMESSLDRQIDVSELEPGFYALFVNDNLEKKRIIYDEVLKSDVFTTVRRYEKVKQIHMVADSDILRAQMPLADNYLFLQVEESDPVEEYADVFIDPYGYTLNALGSIDAGGQGHGLKEYEESYAAAVLLKEKLEELGLKAVIAKDKADDAISYYGKDGRMKKAYDAHARYYLEIGMNTTTDDRYRGMEFYHSHYASETLANTMMYTMKKNTALTPSNMYTWVERSEGVMSSSLTAGDDEKQIYDLLPSLRESGGYGTGAARLNKTAQENADFASENRHGMNALSLNLFYITNSSDVEIWKTDKDAIMSELANAFAKAIGVIE